MGRCGIIQMRWKQTRRVLPASIRSALVPPSYFPILRQVSCVRQLRVPGTRRRRGGGGGGDEHQQPGEEIWCGMECSDKEFNKEISLKHNGYRNGCPSTRSPSLWKASIQFNSVNMSLKYSTICSLVNVWLYIYLYYDEQVYLLHYRHGPPCLVTKRPCSFSSIH